MFFDYNYMLRPSPVRCTFAHLFLLLSYFQQWYKDPTRGDVSYAIMMEEKADIEAMAEAPKAGFEPGCAGCKN